MNLRAAINIYQGDLLKQWEARDSGQVVAYLKVVDPGSCFAWYIIAQNPDFGDEIYCIIDGDYLDCTPMFVGDLEEMTTTLGEPLEIDLEYRPREVGQLIKEITKRKEINGTNFN
jgi:hypothetical protein